MEEKTALLLRFFKATGQPDRLHILGLLATQPHTAVALGQTLGLKETAVGHHLRLLQKAGLVVETDATPYPIFSFDSQGLADLQALVDGRVQPESFAEQVLRRYVVEDELQAIPANNEELSVILNWISQKFQPDHRYTENEVTELVGRYYHKPLILRRLLADHRFLRQTGRQYWRPIANYTHIEG